MLTCWLLNDRRSIRDVFLNFKLGVLKISFLLRNYCNIFHFLSMKFYANVIDLAKTVSSSTHPSKNCGCLSTHSTHTNGDLYLDYGNIIISSNFSRSILLISENNNFSSIRARTLKSTWVCHKRYCWVDKSFSQHHLILSN